MASGAVSALLGALWREVQQREQRRTAEDVMSQLRGVVAEAGVWGSILLFALPKRYKARLEEALAESESAQTPHEVLAAIEVSHGAIIAKPFVSVIESSQAMDWMQRTASLLSRLPMPRQQTAHELYAMVLSGSVRPLGESPSFSELRLHIDQCQGVGFTVCPTQARGPLFIGRTGRWAAGGLLGIGLCAISIALGLLALPRPHLFAPVKQLTPTIDRPADDGSQGASAPGRDMDLPSLSAPSPTKPADSQDAGTADLAITALGKAGEQPRRSSTHEAGHASQEGRSSGGGKPAKEKENKPAAADKAEKSGSTEPAGDQPTTHNGPATK